MKKIFFVLAVALFAASVLSSCSVQKCPAYGQHETEQHDVQS